MKEKLVLIGGSNIDYIGTSNDALISGVSNIGEISSSFGGVMRNISENIARLGLTHTFITALGNDINGKSILKQEEELGVKVLYQDTIYPTGTYLAINDSNHDLAVSICDNRIIKTIDDKYLDSVKDVINKAEYLIIDSNLEKSTIDNILTTYSNKKIMADAISPTKVKKYMDNLDKFYLLKCNIFEARSILNEDDLNAKEACIKLNKYGIENVVVSSAGDDIYFSSKGEIGKYHVSKVDTIVNTTGCGDALFSGIVDSIIRGKSLEEGVALGQKLAVLTLNSSKATTEKVSMYKH